MTLYGLDKLIAKKKKNQLNKKKLLKQWKSNIICPIL